MTLDELNNLQIQVQAGYMEALNNIQNYLESDIKYFELKKDAIKSAAEIFETSLRLIEQEKGKEANETDLKEVLNG